MSNPTTKVAAFNNSLDGFTGVDPIRYSGGLWLEEGMTNIFRNPSAEVDTAGAAVTSGLTLTRDTTEFYVGAASFKVVTDTVTSKRIAFSTATGLGLTGSAYPVIGSVYIKGTGSLVVDVTLIYTDTSSTTGSTTSHTATSTWTRVTAPVLSSNPAKTLDQVTLSVRKSGTSVETFYCDGVQINQKSYELSYCDGAQGTGYAWTGTAHASTSTRAASSASISPTGLLTPSIGAVAFKATRKIDTAAEEIYGEVGQKAAGKDHIRWGIDSSDRAFVEWSSNNAAYQRTTRTGSLAVDTVYDWYIGWNGTAVTLAIEAGTATTGTRDAVSGDWGTGNIKLQAATGGMIYAPFATFSRTLTPAEIAKLDARSTWTRSMFGGSNNQFQLRPY